MNKIFRIRLGRVVCLQIVMAVMLLGMSRSAAAQGYLTLPTVADFAVSCGFGCYTGHGGTDYSTGTTGKDIVAAYDGTVIVASDTDVPNDPSIAWPNTFGNYIKIDHGIINEQRVITLYGHLLHGSFMIKNGMNVLRGQQLAKSGNSGTSTAPHLHFEVKVGGVSKDPYSADSFLWTNTPPVHSTFIPAQGLIQLTGDGTVYWLQRGRIYPVAGPSIIDTMQAAGIANWNWDKIVTVSDISKYTTGPSILTATSDSDNLLIKDVSTKRIYKMNNGVKEYQSTLSSFADVIDMAPAYFAQEPSGTYTVGQSSITDAIRQVFVTTYNANTANLGLPTDVVKETSPGTADTNYYQTFDNGSIQYMAGGANVGSAFAVYGEI